RVDHQLGADFLGQRLLALIVAGFFELLEEVLNLPMVFLKQCDGVGLGGHASLRGLVGELPTNLFMGSCFVGRKISQSLPFRARRLSAWAPATRTCGRRTASASCARQGGGLPAPPAQAAAHPIAIVAASRKSATS